MGLLRLPHQHIRRHQCRGMREAVGKAMGKKDDTEPIAYAASRFGVGCALATPKDTAYLTAGPC